MPLKLYLRGDVWHYRGTAAGRRLRGSTGVSRANKETALRAVADLEARAWKSRLDGPGSILTFAQAAIVYRAAGKSLRYLDRIEDHWTDTPVREITAGRIRASCAELYPKAGNATWNRQVIGPTQAIINYAAEQEMCPRVTVKRWPVEARVRAPTTWEWISAFMADARPNLAALACFLFLTGARIGEAARLRWSDVDLRQGRALIRSTKTQSERWAHLPPELVAAIANIPGDRTGKVFGYSSPVTAGRQWDKAVAKAGLERLTPHCCRHGFATGLLQAGVDPVTVAKLGGWKSPAHVFATYGHASDDRTLTNRLTQKDRADGAKSLRRKRM